MSRLWLTVLTAIVLAVTGWFVWSTDGRSASDQRAAGRELYVERCADCHDLKAGIGPELTADAVRAFGSARALFQYVRFSMPHDAPGSLSDQAYWDVVAYLLASRELLADDVLLNGETADSILLDAKASP